MIAKLLVEVIEIKKVRIGVERRRRIKEEGEAKKDEQMEEEAGDELEKGQSGGKTREQCMKHQWQ